MNSYGSNRDLTANRYYGGTGLPMTFNFMKCGHDAMRGKFMVLKPGAKATPWRCAACQEVYLAEKAAEKAAA